MIMLIIKTTSLIVKIALAVCAVKGVGRYIDNINDVYEGNIYQVKENKDNKIRRFYNKKFLNKNAVKVEGPIYYKRGLFDLYVKEIKTGKIISCIPIYNPFKLPRNTFVPVDVRGEKFHEPIVRLSRHKIKKNFKYNLFKDFDDVNKKYNEQNKKVNEYIKSKPDNYKEKLDEIVNNGRKIVWNHNKIIGKFYAIPLFIKSLSNVKKDFLGNIKSRFKKENSIKDVFVDKLNKIKDKYKKEDSFEDVEEKLPAVIEKNISEDDVIDEITKEENIIIPETKQLNHPETSTTNDAIDVDFKEVKDEEPTKIEKIQEEIKNLQKIKSNLKNEKYVSPYWATKGLPKQEKVIVDTKDKNINQVINELLNNTNNNHYAEAFINGTKISTKSLKSKEDIIQYYMYKNLGIMPASKNARFLAMSEIKTSDVVKTK
ncbi:MAG: hypothetical protein SOZ95_05415 [Bacilli bacterium]|nr:hypothetical protein [Bacilli bacterium]